MKGSQGRNSRKEPEGKSRGRGPGGVLPTGLFPMAHLAYTTQDHLPKGGTTHSKLGPPTSIINQGNAPCAYPQANLNGSIFSIEDPAFR